MDKNGPFAVVHIPRAAGTEVSVREGGRARPIVLGLRGDDAWPSMAVHMSIDDAIRLSAQLLDAVSVARDQADQRTRDELMITQPMPPREDAR